MSLTSLRDDTRGVAVIEMAFTAPLLVLLILGMVEYARYAIVRQALSQAAFQIADNAARLGETGLTGAMPISEKQINDVLLGGRIQGGPIDLQQRGRIILTSLERNATQGQWLHWQRCAGALPHRSSWGVEGDGATGQAVDGMGPPNGRIQARDGIPVQFVEIAYAYRPMVLAVPFMSANIIESAAVPVRLNRDLKYLSNDQDAPISKC